MDSKTAYGAGADVVPEARRVERVGDERRMARSLDEGVEESLGVVCRSRDDLPAHEAVLGCDVALYVDEAEAPIGSRRASRSAVSPHGIAHESAGRSRCRDEADARAPPHRAAQGLHPSSTSPRKTSSPELRPSHLNMWQIGVEALRAAVVPAQKL